MTDVEAPRGVAGEVDSDPTVHQKVYWGLRRRLGFNGPGEDLRLNRTFRFGGGEVPVDITVTGHGSDRVFLGIRFDGHEERRVYSSEGLGSLYIESAYPPPEGLKPEIDTFITQVAGMEG